jgi:hypothetical protein
MLSEVTRNSETPKVSAFTCTFLHWEYIVLFAADNTSTLLSYLCTNMISGRQVPHKYFDNFCQLSIASCYHPGLKGTQLSVEAFSRSQTLSGGVATQADPEE